MFQLSAFMKVSSEYLICLNHSGRKGWDLDAQYLHIGTFPSADRSQLGQVMPAASFGSGPSSGSSKYLRMRQDGFEDAVGVWYLVQISLQHSLRLFMVELSVVLTRAGIVPLKLLGVKLATALMAVAISRGRWS